MEEKKEFNLNDHVHRLLIQEPFFAALSRTIEKISSKSVPTAGVRIDADTGYFEMYYNPDFFASLTDKQRSGVLVHEFYHLIFEHVTGRLPDELKSVMSTNKGMNTMSSDVRAKFMLWNIAADLSINCHIGQDRLPEKCVFPGVDKFSHMPSQMNAEWYYRELLKEGEAQAEQSDGEKSLEDYAKELVGGQFDEHDGWGEVDETSQAIAKERLKEALKEAAKEASSGNSWGSVTSSVRKDIMERINAKVDWRNVLRYFVKTCMRAEKRSTVRRINKRYPYIHPGKKVKRIPSIAISIDQSGSVSDAMLNAFFNELSALADLCTFTVIPFDTEVATDKVFVWKKGEKKKWERVLCGGTDFNPPTKYVNEHKFNGHIVLTDMCAPKPVASRCQRMWMTDSYNAKNPYFKTHERVIPISV